VNTDSLVRIIGKKEILMTYLELFHKIEAMTMEQKMMDVTHYDSGDDEFYPVGKVVLSQEMEAEDVLDKDHPILL